LIFRRIFIIIQYQQKKFRFCSHHNIFFEYTSPWAGF
jgi:hypothetical protein